MLLFWLPLSWQLLFWLPPSWQEPQQLSSLHLSLLPLSWQLPQPPSWQLPSLPQLPIWQVLFSLPLAKQPLFSLLLRQLSSQSPF